MTTLLCFPQILVKGRKSFHLTTEPEKVQQWKTIDRARNRWISGIKPVVASVFKDEQIRVRRAIKSMLTTNSVVESVEEEVRSARGVWSDLLKNIYIPVGRALAESVIRDIRKSDRPIETKILAEEIEEFRGLVDESILNYLQNASASAVKIDRINTTTLRLLRAELRAGVEAGEGIDKIAERIDALYLDQIIPNRSTVIARTEVIQASNMGSMAGAKATGIPRLKKVWLATRDIRTRESHLVNDGETVEIDSAFTLDTGSRLMFPGDTSLGASPADTIQCRCTQFYEGEENGL